MSAIFTSKVEQAYNELSLWSEITTRIPYITVDNFPKLGLLTSFRFLEWASENPKGVISLPQEKHPSILLNIPGSCSKTGILQKVMNYVRNVGSIILKSPTWEICNLFKLMNSIPSIPISIIVFTIM